MSRILPVHPLTREAFAPYGDVIGTDPSTMRLINDGTTERFHRLALIEAEGDGAIISIFRGQPRSFPYKLGMMERHPQGSQSFFPLSNRPFLVAVSDNLGGEPGVPKVFLVPGDQGVNYRRHIWHHPLMALGDACDFLVVDRDRPESNLEEYVFDTPYSITEPMP